MTEKRSSVLNQISLFVLIGSLFGAFFVGFLVFILLSEHDSQGAFKKAIFSYIITQIVFLVVVYVIRLSIDRTIISRIKSITKAMDEVSLGNLDVEVKTSGNDEITDLAEAFERMRISMKTVIEKLEK